ncbi:MAG: lactonase family protein [Bacteroidota bacterium]
MKKSLFAALLLAPALSFAQQKIASTAKTYDLLLGGYTLQGYTKGISVYRFDTETGKATLLSQVEGIDNPDFLALSSDNKFVYSCNVNPKGGVEAEVSAFKFDKASGKLTLINKVAGGGINPVHISIDKDNKNVIVSYYSSGSVAVLPINKDGSIGAVKQSIKYTGGSVHRNQRTPHVHMAIFDDSYKKVLVADLGSDKVYTYNYDNTKAEPLSPADPAYELTQPGDGPRHIEFSADKKFAYIIQELSGYVRAYKYDNGKLTFIQTIAMMPEDFKPNSAADIHISPDGNYLYASNRAAADNVVQYAINKKDGKLSFVDRYPVSNEPRGFTIDPTGSYLLSAGQEGNTIVFYKIDKATGKLTAMDNKLDIPQVTCFKWVAVD